MGGLSTQQKIIAGFFFLIIVGIIIAVGFAITGEQSRCERECKRNYSAHTHRQDCIRSCADQQSGPRH